MDSKQGQQEGLIVTIEANCGSVRKDKAFDKTQELSEECLTVLAQGEFRAGRIYDAAAAAEQQWPRACSVLPSVLPGHNSDCCRYRLG